MFRYFPLLFVLVICAIILTDNRHNEALPAEKELFYRKRTKVCIIIILVFWVLTAFGAFVPLSNMFWVLGMYMAAITALAYLFLWLIMFRHREKRIDDVLMLFMPIYFLTGITIATWGREECYYTAIIVSLITVALTVLSLVQKPVQERLRIRNNYLIIMAVSAVILVITCIVLASVYFDYVHSDQEVPLESFLYNSPFYALALLLIMFFVFLFIGREKSSMDNA